MNDQLKSLSTQEKILLAHLDQLPSDDKALVLRAFNFAKQAHQGQKRLGGDDFIIHPIRIAISLYALADVRDPDILSAALLHDVVEDTPVAIEEIATNFNPEIHRLVNNLTIKEQLTGSEDDRWKIKSAYYKSILAQDEKTRLIKAGDVCDNVASWVFIKDHPVAQKKLPRWFKESESFYMPIAKSTNDALYQKLKTELANLKNILSA